VAHPQAQRLDLPTGQVPPPTRQRSPHSVWMRLHRRTLSKRSWTCGLPSTSSEPRSST
jgi:hypothetical protein